MGLQYLCGHVKVVVARHKAYATKGLSKMLQGFTQTRKVLRHIPSEKKRILMVWASMGERKERAV